MNVGFVLSSLLGAAVLIPLLSFVLILLFGPRMGKKGRLAGPCDRPRFCCLASCR